MSPFEESPPCAAVEFDDDSTSVAAFRDEIRRLKEAFECKEREFWKVSGERDALERTLAKFIDNRPVVGFEEGQGLLQDQQVEIEALKQRATSQQEEIQRLKSDLTDALKQQTTNQQEEIKRLKSELESNKTKIQDRNLASTDNGGEAPGRLTDVDFDSNWDASIETFEKTQSPAPSNDKAAAASSKATVAPLSQNLLERHIKSMRWEFIADGGNVDQLLLNMGEIAGTPDAGIKLVSLSAERLMECKEDERKAIYSILPILFEKKKLSKEDVREGCTEIIEFLDSFVMDFPKAYEYLGQLLGEMLRVKAFDMVWLCEQCENIKVADPDTITPEKVIRFSLKTLKAKGGNLAVKAAISDEKLVTALLGAPTWQSISKEVS
jgi:DNA repair exonuclease SbcCD ATPase subunit